MSSSSDPFQPLPPSKSSYRPIEKPDFSPNIPPYLVDGMSDQDRFIVENLSVMSQYAKWSVETQMMVHEQVRATNGRLLRVEAETNRAREELDNLNEKAETMEPFFKPLNQFVNLWDYRLFRYGCYIVAFFLLTYALPWYLKNPLDLGTFLSALFGGS